TFRNSGEQDGELLISTSPSGFERYFAECAEVFNQPGPPDMEAIVAISDRHGIEFVQPAWEIRENSPQSKAGLGSLRGPSSPIL
ncbi:MAG TPA: hypothetical protein VJ960_03480, partial [Oceanipulchritudo sp.]|nr:hypothetical protein [Oceanipulchritudo sp.]